MNEIQNGEYKLIVKITGEGGWGVIDLVRVRVCSGKY